MRFTLDRLPDENRPLTIPTEGLRSQPVGCDPALRLRIVLTLSTPVSASVDRTALRAPQTPVGTSLSRTNRLWTPPFGRPENAHFYPESCSLRGCGEVDKFVENFQRNRGSALQSTGFILGQSQTSAGVDFP